MNGKELTAQMTLQEKASLCSGLDFWRLKGVERLGLYPVMVTDGPHGLRKQVEGGDHLGIGASVPATCFPTASATANSFDRQLLAEIGGAIGEECLQEGVSVLLAPGANIKRSPLCGRNFEYFSEDPYLTGELAAAFIEGVQQKGVGTAIKHFAANNQEKYRMTSNSVIDDRALREIYLSGFERAVKKGRLYSVMCSYNLLNGVYVNENYFLLTEVLRKEWGFDGVVMTDWGAVTDRVKGLAAGLDLEMPASNGVTDAEIAAAVQNNSLDEAVLDTAAARVADLILTAQDAKKPDYQCDMETHHALALRAARESAVLLKNDDAILPLAASKSIAVIGAFAKTPRYQGAGSSKINPYRIDNALDALKNMGADIEYAPGYLTGEKSGDEETLLNEACALAVQKDMAIIFAGLPDEYESEGFDRVSLDMPQSHNRLIEMVAKANPNTAVVLQTGSPVVMPWADSVKGILLAGLGGQAGGTAVAELLTGKAVPCGKLAESYPLALTDTPCFNYFAKDSSSAEYRESIFVGYRYYDTAGKQTAYPFGHGLSYTTFAYSDLTLSRSEWKPGDELEISVQIQNTGTVSGVEIAQLYLGINNSRIYRAAKELKGFEKVFLSPGESKTLVFRLDTRSFAYYNTAIQDWAVESGEYTISVGASIADIRLTQTVRVSGDGKEALLSDMRERAPTYYHLPHETLAISDDEFEAIYGKNLPPSKRLPEEPFTLNSRLNEVQGTFIGRKLRQGALAALDKMFGAGQNTDLELMMRASVMESPLRSLIMFSRGTLSKKQLTGLLAAINLETRIKRFFEKKIM
ncbi:MAG: glycoside hydrolase family 3 C-terminal domain-containing protein [Spirochaetaceae bacterium]|jgi:beta-glucosidase|nr:glycoside hydrolase family 3 C-terminal domain-containing protein [Spirochaetaceae bacterium]